jgi:phage shock protein E
MFQPTISCNDAQTLLAQGARLIDVRHPREYRRNALPGSVNIPLGTLRKALRQLDRETPVLLYCSSGQRSGAARRLLEACGFCRVHNLGSYTDYDNWRESDGKT